MNILIDASNIIVNSGGFNHLKELLKNYPVDKKDEIYVVGSNKLISELKFTNPKIKYVSNFFLNSGKLLRLIWQIFLIKSCLKKNNCKKLFVLGGYFFWKGNYKTILLLQNILPLEKKIFLEDNLLSVLKNYTLNILYKFSISRSDGVILLSKYSIRFLGKKKVKYRVIQHGLNKFFQRKFKIRKNKKIFNILYVSKYEKYKNHMNLVRACYYLRKININIKLTLIGLKGDKKYNKSKLYEVIENTNSKFQNLISVENFKKHSSMKKIYSKYDLHVYASKCESFGFIVLESIASCLPIICSNYPVYKEILGKHTLYFNPNNPKNIAKIIKIYIQNFKLKKKNTKKLNDISKNFKWKDCSKKTFEFIKAL